MEVANDMDSSSKCSKMSSPVENEQDFYLSIQPNVINSKLLLIIKHFSKLFHTYDFIDFREHFKI